MIHVQKKAEDLNNLFLRLGIVESPSLGQDIQILQASCIDTRLGQMLIIADEESVYMVEFIECRNLQAKLKRFESSMKALIVVRRGQLVDMLERELYDYFAGDLLNFKTPFLLLGTPFQKRVWQELQQIPYGQTRSYAEIAAAIGKPSAFRAVALANSANMICVIVPCHRVIQSTGALGGYASGMERKQWLLNHEGKVR
jgi:AraC family transcriptional regulator of adaptative response/methylated-DNA-[protein]-cysteine methyltransferase